MSLDCAVSPFRCMPVDCPSLGWVAQLLDVVDSSEPDNASERAVQRYIRLTDQCRGHCIFQTRFTMSPGRET